MSKDRISVMPMLRRGVETKLGVQLAWAAQHLVLLRLGRDATSVTIDIWELAILPNRYKNELFSSCGVLL